MITIQTAQRFPYIRTVAPLRYNHCVFAAMKTAHGAVLPKPVVAPLPYNHCVFAAMKTARGAVLPKPVVASLRFHSAASPSRERHMIRSRSASPPSRQRHRIVGADAPGGPRDECPSLFKYAHRNAMKESLNLYTQCFHVLNFMFHLQSSALLNKEGLRPSGRRGRLPRGAGEMSRSDRGGRPP